MPTNIFFQQTNCIFFFNFHIKYKNVDESTVKTSNVEILARSIDYVQKKVTENYFGGALVVLNDGVL